MTKQLLNKFIAKANEKYPWHLVQIPRSQWEGIDGAVTRRSVWRSRDFLVQVFDEPNGIVRLSINRTSVQHGGWSDGIPWEELQRLKSQAGYGECDAVEVYPRDADTVNVANMRHLWVFTDGRELTFVWRARAARKEHLTR